MRPLWSYRAKRRRMTRMSKGSTLACRQLAPEKVKVCRRSSGLPTLWMLEAHLPASVP